MTISELVQHFTFHDSGVSSVEISEDEKTISFKFELGNYMQVGFRNGDPEIITGTLRFNPVVQLEAIPDLQFFQWGEDFDGEILKVSLLSNALKNMNQGVEFVIHTIEYSTKKRDVLVIRVFASNVEWIPNPVKGEIT